MAPAASHLILIQVHRTPDGAVSDFEFRVVGEYLNERTAEPHAGRRLSSFAGKGPGSKIWRSYLTVVETAQPLRVSLDYVGPLQSLSRSDEIYLPLSDATPGRVDYVLVAVLLDA